MTPRNGLLLAGAALLAMTLFGLLALTTAYWPFQSVVEVIAPFLILAILTSVGTSLLVVGFVFPGKIVREAEQGETAGAIDSLLAETKRGR